MCGSGTIPIEAAMIASNKAPGSVRDDFGFLRWKDFDADLWKDVQEQAQAREREPAHPVFAFDQDFKAVRMSQRNAMQAGVDTLIQFQRHKFEKLKDKHKPADRGLLIMNPPYDERLTEQNIETFYQMIGDQFKQVFPGWTGWVISSNVPALKSLGLRASERKTVFNGALECKYMKFDLYEGSK